MIIVLIHWKIHLHDEARRSFFSHWKDTLTVSERSHLVGEFLSKPLSIDQTSFPCSLFNVPSHAQYESYFNVGLWQDVGAFKSQVIDPFVSASQKPESFEFEYRERMLLSPISWRSGEFALPLTDHFST